MIHFVEKAEQDLLRPGKKRSFGIAKYCGNDLFASGLLILFVQQNRRDRGVRLRSKRALIAR